MRKLLIALAGFMLEMAAPVSAASKQCQLVKYLELPVQLIGRRAIVTTQIGGKEARFILDSGAFYSTMSHASALQYGLMLDQAPPGFRLNGINGGTSVEIGTARDFVLGGVPIPKVEFLVGGTDTGTVGLLGQNFLSMFDVEYDFPHGMIRLMKAGNCPGVSAAYWADEKPVTTVNLAPRMPPFKVHTIGTVMLNGVKLHATFDTGATSTNMTLAAAKRVGVTPETPGVKSDGFSIGIGSKSLKAWYGPFTKLDIGGEAIPNPKLRFSDMELNDSDMLIGFDFFLTHRIFVLNRSDKMLITYEGGAVFGLNPARAVDSSGATIDLSTKNDAAPTDAEGFARRGSVLASGGKLEAAIADFDQAVTLAPGNARYLKDRAAARMANRQPLLAMSDYEKAIAIDPADPDTHQGRAQLRLISNDRKGTLEDLQAMDKLLPPSGDRRLGLAGLYGAVDDYPTAIANYDLWLKYHPEDAARPVALNGRCWARALANRELDKALEDCNAAIRARPKDAAYLDSRGLVRFRRGDWAQSKTDYDAALALTPRNALALYVRGLARGKLGDTAGADADRAAALALQPRVGARATKLGLKN